MIPAGQGRICSIDDWSLIIRSGNRLCRGGLVGRADFEFGRIGGRRWFGVAACDFGRWCVFWRFFGGIIGAGRLSAGRAFGAGAWWFTRDGGTGRWAARSALDDHRAVFTTTDDLELISGTRGDFDDILSRCGGSDTAAKQQKSGHRQRGQRRHHQAWRQWRNGGASSH